MLHCSHQHQTCLGVLLQVSGEAIMRGLQAALENAPSALAARSVLEGFDIATRYPQPCDPTPSDCPLQLSLFLPNIKSDI